MLPLGKAAGPTVKPPELDAPVPVRLTACGVFAALSAMLRVPLRVPVAVGVKSTLMSQLALGASGDAAAQAGFCVTLLGIAQPAVCAKHWKSPVVVRPAKLRFAFPMFVTVTVCSALVVPTVCDANASAAVDNWTAGPFACPPCSAMECGLPAAVSLMVSVAVRKPRIVGVNFTGM